MCHVNFSMGICIPTRGGGGYGGWCQLNWTPYLTLCLPVNAALKVHQHNCSIVHCIDIDEYHQSSHVISSNQNSQLWLDAFLTCEELSEALYTLSVEQSFIIHIKSYIFQVYSVYTYELQEGRLTDRQQLY